MRVFTSGMDGLIVEVDAAARSERTAPADSFGGAVWNMALKECGEKVDADDMVVAEEEDGSSDDEGPTEMNAAKSLTEGRKSSDGVIAAACDDGCVRLYAVEHDVPGVKYLSSLPAVEGRVLCVAWYPESNRLVFGGTDGCLHVWDTETKREILRITVAGSAHSTQDEVGVCVWTVLVLGDGTIVSGDSKGAVSFWDGQFGTLIARFCPTGADILTLAVSPKGDCVFSAGVDPKISIFKRVNTKDGGAEWSYLSSKREHALDIKALCVCAGRASLNERSSKTTLDNDARLFSGGNDSMVLSHSVGRFLKENPVRVNANPQLPKISIAPSQDVLDNDATIFAASFQNVLDLWKVPSIQPSQLTGKQEGDKILQHGNSLVHLARVSNSSGASINTVALSDDGSILIFSSTKNTRCFKISGAVESGEMGEIAIPIIDPDFADKRTLALVPVPLPTADLCHGTITHVLSIPGTHSFLFVYHDGVIRIVESVGSDATKVQTIRDIHDLRYKPWFKKDSSKSAAKKESSMLDLIDISPNGEYAAVCLRNRIFILSLATRHLVAQVPSVTSVSGGLFVAALCFVSEKGDYLAVATSAGKIGMFETVTGKMQPLVGQPDESPSMHRVPLDGAISGMIRSPSAQDKAVIVYSSQALCHIDFSKSLINEEHEEAKMGRRPRDRGARIAHERAEVGRNCRVLPCQHPLLNLSKMGDHQLMMIQKSWEHVWKSRAAPLYTHKYGS